MLFLSWQPEFDQHPMIWNERNTQLNEEDHQYSMHIVQYTLCAVHYYNTMWNSTQCAIIDILYRNTSYTLVTWPHYAACLIQRVPPIYHFFHIFNFLSNFVLIILVVGNVCSRIKRIKRIIQLLKIIFTNWKLKSTDIWILDEKY